MDSLLQFMNALDGFLQNHGTVSGLLILCVVFLVWRNWRQNEERLADKDREIARLAADVREMRDRMTALWDSRYGVGPEKKKGKSND